MSSKLGRSLASWPLRHPWAFGAGCLGTLAVMTAVICAVVATNGTYPEGVDTLYYVHKGDALYRSIQQGTRWPLYDPLWYNGTQFMRYWAPLPVYVFAGCEALAGGNALHAFVVFCGVVFLIGALTWTYIGMKVKRPWLGLLVGMLWFLLPNNLVALFSEGNLPRCLSLAVVPLLVYFANRYLTEGSWKQLPAITALLGLVALRHVGFAVMVAIAITLYLVCYGLICRTWKRGLAVIAAMLLGFAVIGVWLVPALIGNALLPSNAPDMADYFQSLWVTLNPFERLTSGNTASYFGCAAAALCVFGFLFAKRRSMPGFLAAALIVLCTSEAAQPALSKLPGSDTFWMLCYLSIALAFMLFSFLTWRTLKTPLVVLVCALLVADAVPSWGLAYGNQSGSDPQQRLENTAQRMLVDQAQDATTQRLALVDDSRFDSESIYVATGLNNPVAISEGAPQQPCVTAENYTLLDEALAQGQFDYLFDRSLELGNDSVLVLTSLASVNDDSIGAHLDSSAARLGYHMVGQNGEYRLYHRDTPATFGVKSTYRAIAIGSSASTVALQFPAFEQASSQNLNDYMFDQLKQYDVVFLGGFTFNDRSAAEDLVNRLADEGVRVVIAADGIPTDEHTGQHTFLGLDCEDITFSNGFPELQTDEGALVTTLFPNGHQNWSTVYVNGIAHPSATIKEGDRTLPVCGTLNNPNIAVIGLNLTYYESLTHDANAQALLAGILGVDPDELPQRDVVPLDVTYGADGRTITVASREDDVCTTLSYQDIFTSNSKLTRKNNLLYVNSGTTVIQLRYPYLWQGVAVSAAGLAASAAFFAIMRNRERKRPTSKG